MIRLAANLSTLFTEYAFLERFGAAAAAGFSGVECQFPYAVPAAAIAAELHKHGLTQVLFNTPPGDVAAGERGIAGIPGRQQDFLAGIATALDYARATGCRALHVMAGKLVAGSDAAAQRAAFVENLALAADAVAADDICVLVEPINTRVDVPGYLIDSTAAAMECIRAANRPNVGLQFDAYHMQIMEGDLARRIEALLPAIGHIQIAANPGRHEPDAGEVDFRWLLARIDALGYGGWIGCEYLPAAGTQSGLAWARPYLRGA